MPKSIFYVEYLSLMSPEVFREKLTHTHTIDKTGTWKGEWIDDKRFRIEISGIKHPEVTIDKLVIRGKVVSDESSEMIDKRVFRMYLWTRMLPSFSELFTLVPIFFPLFCFLIFFLILIWTNVLPPDSPLKDDSEPILLCLLYLNLLNIIFHLIHIQVKHKKHLSLFKKYIAWYFEAGITNE